MTTRDGQSAAKQAADGRRGGLLVVESIWTPLLSLAVAEADRE